MLPSGATLLGLVAAIAVFSASGEAQTDVLVIGGGISGLSAARSLLASGYSVRVLEARERMGGRLWTVPITGGKIDMGGAWIHGITGNPITKIATQNNIRYLKTGFYSVVYGANGRVQTERQTQEGDALKSNFDQFLAARQPSLTRATSLGQVITSYAVTKRLSNTALATLMAQVDWDYTQEYAASPNQLAAADFDGGESFNGADAMFPDGYAQIIDVLAKGVSVQLRSPVTQITCESNGVKVRLSNGTSISAKAAVVTLPLGVLQSLGASLFMPQLPVSKSTAISRMGMGLLNKVVLVFPRVFWENSADWLDRVPATANDTFFVEWFNVAKQLPQMKALVAFNAGTPAWVAESMSDTVMVSRALGVLRKLYGAENVPAPIDTRVTRWGSDRYSRGAYSFTKVGATWDDHATLAAPFRRCFFAGEHTSSLYPATVHGAYISGGDAAQAVMDQL